MSATEKANTLQAVEKILNYPITNRDLLWEALQASGSTLPGEPYRINSNKRLAIIGDGILGLVLKTDWYRSGAPLERVDYIIQDVASNKNLNRVGLTLGIDQHVDRHGTGALSYSPVPMRTMADTMEAILGAVFLDGGIDAVRRVMGTLGLVPGVQQGWR